MVNIKNTLGMFVIFGSVPGLLWSCQDSRAIAPRSEPVVFVTPTLAHHPIKRIVPAAKDDGIEHKLNDLSGSIDQLKETIKTLPSKELE